MLQTCIIVQTFGIGGLDRELLVHGISESNVDLTRTPFDPTLKFHVG